MTIYRNTSGSAIAPGRRSGVVYIGVPFKCGFVGLTGLKSKGVDSLLADYANAFALLRELSDQPETWLEPEGKGIVRIAGQT